MAASGTLVCEFCQGTYAGARNLRKHLHRKHAALLPALCRYCPRRLIDERSRYVHEGHAHPERFESRKSDLATRRAYNLRAKYGIEPEDYERMLVKQGGGCAVCGATEADQLSRRLHVDHDHATGRVRGLLCGPCNHAIGKAGDDPERLRRMAAYLEAVN